MHQVGLSPPRNRQADLVMLDGLPYDSFLLEFFAEEFEVDRIDPIHSKETRHQTFRD